MTLLDKLERRFGKAAIPHLTPIIILGQVTVFLVTSMGMMDLGSVLLVGELVMSGEYYRLGMFLFTPPSDNIFWAFIAWWLFMLMGNGLEKQWGAFKYNIYLLIAAVMTMLCAFIYPMVPITNTFIGTSVFLAFAHLYPDFTLHLFFVLPVKIKYLAYFAWAGIALVLVASPLPLKVMAIASVVNYLLFFGRDFFKMAKAKKRRDAFKAETAARSSEAFHTCAVCGITDQTNPTAVFRYCSDCQPTQGYCDEHFPGHTCLTGNETPSTESVEASDNRKIDSNRYKK